MDHKEEKIEALYRLILQLKTAEDCHKLFDDLCTVKEIEKMAERVFAAKLLLEGKTNRIVCTHEGGFTDVDIDEGLSMKKGIQKMEVDVLAAMTGI